MADLNIKNPSVTEDALAIHLDASGNIDRISGHGLAGAGGGGGSMNYYGDDVYIKNTGAAGNIFTLTESVKAKLEQIQPTYTPGTDIIVDEYNTIQVNTNGSANSTGMAFVEGVDTIASGVASHAEGQGNKVYSDYSHIEGYNNTDYKIDGLVGSNHTEGAYNQTSGVYSHNEGHANTITGYGVHVQGGYNKFKINNVSADTTHSDKTNRWNVWGISIEGMANATTAEPTSGSINGNDYGYIHGGILKVIGNGTRTLTDPSDPETEVITRSDALIIYRDGSISAAGNISANGVELGAGGGGTSYQGRNGVNVDGGYVELTTTAYESVTSVPSISNDVDTLKGASGNWNKVSDKLDTTAFSTVSGDFLTEIPNEYVTSSNVSTQGADYVMTTTGWKVLTLPGGGMTQVIHDETLTGQGNADNSKLGVAWSALSGNTINSAKSAGSATSALSADKAASASASKRLQDSTSGPVIQVGDITALQHWASSNSSTWDDVTAKLGTAQYATDSATFVTSSNASISAAGEQYALTTTGWAKVQAGSTFTGVTTDNTLTGNGTDASHKLSVAWSALSSNKIDSAKSANSAEYITNGVGYSGFNDISAKFDSLTSYVPYSATVLPIGTNNTATNNSIAIGSNNTANDLGFAVGQSNTALKRSLAFGVGNYANDISLAIGYNNSASGKNDNNQSAVNIAIGYANSAADHAAALINVCTAENYAFAAGHANSAIDNSVAFCRNTSAKFYSFGFGHLNHVENYSYAFGRDLHYEGQWANGSQYGAFVIGGWNATTSYATTADAPVFIIGNGENGRRSDGFIVYRDGDVTAAGKISANGMFAVSTDATLFGQSRIANVGDTTALGTNWMGVTNDGQGFLKSISGNNVGSLNGTSIQINYKPNNAYGEITVKNSNAGTDGDSKIVHVPTASYNNMSVSSQDGLTTGPNYFVVKTASGFDIGAAVINVTSMPQSPQPNTYYFIYDT